MGTRSPELWVEKRRSNGQAACRRRLRDLKFHRLVLFGWREPSAVSHEQFLLSTPETGRQSLEIREGDVDGRLLNVTHIAVGKAALPCQFVLGVSAREPILLHVVCQS